MEVHKFKKMINDLYYSFRLKDTPSNDVIGSWYEDVKHIPDAMIPEIMFYFKDLDNLPRNMPKSIKYAWRKWKHEHPSKVTYRGTQCDQCATVGHLWATKKEGEAGYNYEYVFRCGHCENWKKEMNNAIPRKTVQQIQAGGYVFVPLIKKQPLPENCPF